VDTDEAFHLGRADNIRSMATKQVHEEKPGRKTQKLNVWLTEQQIGWLKSDPGGPSAAVRALIAEAINLQNLAKSVKGGKKKRAGK
jgi:hypothetical protein